MTPLPGLNNGTNGNILAFIPVDILLEHGAVLTHYDKKEHLFREGEQARYFYQIDKGTVRMYSSTTEGKEITQGYFRDGQSFGEPPLLINQSYPANALATTEASVYKLSKAHFALLLEQHNDIQMQLLQVFAHRLHRKAHTHKELIMPAPKDRIMSFLQWYKREQQTGMRKTPVHYTRQEIAHFTGLCVETVIRTLSQLKEQKLVHIIDRKLYV